jgi:hypothetical protein
MTGRDDGQHVTIEIAAGGLTSCTIEPDRAATDALHNEADNDIVRAVSTPCEEGATAMSEIADTYDAEDKDAAHRLRDLSRARSPRSSWRSTRGAGSIAAMGSEVFTAPGIAFFLTLQTALEHF